MAWAVARARLLMWTRLRIEIALEVLMPILVTAMPMLLGRASVGARASANFAANTGTDASASYLLVGAIAFVFVTRSFWDLSYWVRREQEEGTLQSIYLAPASPTAVVAGVAMASAARSSAVAALAYVLGCAVLGARPLQGQWAIALAFVALGVVPTYGIALVLASLGFRVVEAGKLVEALQWLAGLLMGIYYPVKVLPAALRAVAHGFPPTWMTGGVRSALFGLGWFLDGWYLDLVVLGSFALAAPLVGLLALRRAEASTRKTRGFGCA